MLSRNKIIDSFDLSTHRFEAIWNFMLFKIQMDPNCHMSVDTLMHEWDENEHPI